MSKTPYFAIDFNEMSFDKLFSLILKRLCLEGVVILKNVPVNSNDALIRISHALGVPSLSGLNREGGASSMVEDSFIRRVEAVESPIKNTLGKNVLSSTSDSFSLHTDEYYEDIPSKFVILLCVNPDDRGEGKTLISDIRKVLYRLPTEVVAHLKEYIFPHPAGFVSVLTIKDQLSIRYNRYSINSKLSISQKHIKVNNTYLDLFDKTLCDSAESILLSKGDCIIIDNEIILHGRTAFSEQSQRLLKRVRVRRQM